MQMSSTCTGLLDISHIMNKLTLVNLSDCLLINIIPGFITSKQYKYSFLNSFFLQKFIQNITHHNNNKQKQGNTQYIKTNIAQANR